MAVRMSMCCEVSDALSKRTRRIEDFTYLDLARISDDRLEVDGVYQRFPQGDVFDTRVVEPIDIVPDCPA